VDVFPVRFELQALRQSYEVKEKVASAESLLGGIAV